jgi:hypothetical protein
MDRMKAEFESQLREIHNDNEMALKKADIQIQKLEDSLHSSSRQNEDLSQELHRQESFIQKLKIEHEEELRRSTLEAREDEYRKAQLAIRDLDGKF